MQLSTAFWGAALGGAVGLLTKHEKPWEYALWGGGAGLAFSFVRGDKPGGFLVGDLPFSLPTPGLPGQLIYNVDPRTDPMLDPVSRQQLYPVWMLTHWQNGDRKIIASVQRALGLPGDGLVGGATATAIRNFQAQAGLSQTGTMDNATMAALVSGG